MVLPCHLRHIAFIPMSENESSQHVPVPLPALAQKEPRPESATIAQATPDAAGIRAFLQSRGSASVADRTFGAVMLLGALSLFVIMALIVNSHLRLSILSHKQLGSGQRRLRRVPLHLWHARFLVAGLDHRGSTLAGGGHLCAGNLSRSPAWACVLPH